MTLALKKVKFILKGAIHLPSGGGACSPPLNVYSLWWYFMLSKFLESLTGSL